MLQQALEWARYILLMQWPFSGEVYLACLVVSSCVNARGGNRRFDGMLVPGFAKVLMTTCGSGIVGPMLLRDPPLFLADDRLVTCIVIFYLLSVRFDPHIVNFASKRPIWNFMTMITTMSRMNKICLIVDYAFKKLTSSGYYPVAIFGPILIGLTRGIGGSLVPCDKGLSIVQREVPWKVQLCLAVAAFYHIVANDPYIVGGLVRGMLGMEDLPRADVRFIAAAFGMTVTFIHVYIDNSFNPFRPVHKVLYAFTGLQRTHDSTITTESSSVAANGSPGAKGNGGAKEGNGRGDSDGDSDEAKDAADGESRALYDLRARKKTQYIFDALKPAVVALAAVLAFYSRHPPSTILPGTVIKPGDAGLAACAFLPAPLRGECEPLRASLTDSGSLVIYKGGSKVPELGKRGKTKHEGSDGSSPGEVVWASPMPPRRKVEAGDVKLELSDDGILIVKAGDRNLWSSSLTPFGKKLPPYGVEAKLDAAKGALEVYKGGKLQWSSAGRVK